MIMSVTLPGDQGVKKSGNMDADQCRSNGYNKNKNENEVDVSITIQTLLPRKMQVCSAFKPLVTAMSILALVTLSACARGPDMSRY